MLEVRLFLGLQMSTMRQLFAIKSKKNKHNMIRKSS